MWKCARIILAAIMAAIDQVSDDGLLLTLSRSQEKNNFSKPLLKESSNTTFDIEKIKHEAKVDQRTNKEWSNRIKDAGRILDELISLQMQKKGPQSLDVALSHLSAGILYGYAYGTNFRVGGGFRFFSGPTFGDRTDMDLATFHFKTAYDIISANQEAGDSLKLTAEFLLAKHTLYAAYVHTKPGHYDLYTNEKIPPTPEAKSLFELSDTHLENVLKEMEKIRAARPVTPNDQKFYTYLLDQIGYLRALEAQSTL